MRWKLYFSINVLLFIFGIVSLILLNTNLYFKQFNPSSNLLLDIIVSIFSLITLVGLFSFVFKKGILKPDFGKVILVIEILYLAYGIISDIVTYLIPGHSPLPQASITVVVSTIFIGIIWYIPLIYALFKLSFPPKLPQDNAAEKLPENKK